tara:strand:- start:123 stop:332 length:210 start_codon:yes stop_codon:yes gene_type:complete
VVLANADAARRETLPLGRVTAKRCCRVSTGFNQPGQWHFEASQSAVRDMIKQPSALTRADMTIIFDAPL